MTKRKRNQSNKRAAAAVTDAENRDGQAATAAGQMMMNMSESDEVRYLEEIRTSFYESAKDFTDSATGRAIYRQLCPVEYYINKRTGLPIRIIFIDAIEMTPEQLAANSESPQYTMIDETHRCEILVLGFVRIFSDAFNNGDSTPSAEPGVRYQLTVSNLEFCDIERVDEWTPEQIREFTQFLEHPDVFIRRMGVLPVLAELQNSRR